MHRREFLKHLPLIAGGLAGSGLFLASCSKENNLEYFDLSDGILRFLQPSPQNSWDTEIQSILEVVGADNQIAYLSHECRAENIGPNIFDNDRVYEWLGLKSWRGNIIFRSGVLLPNYGRTKEKLQTEVFAPKRKIKVVSFTELIESKIASAVNNKRLYFNFEYQLNNQTYRIGAPVRYINYGFNSEKNSYYLQPISGCICFEIEGNFHIGYLAVYIENNIVSGAQIVSRTISATPNIYKTKPLDSNYLFTTEFNKVLVLDHQSSTITFFNYVPLSSA